ncbi:MAG: hypothetical protein CL916_10135 [Deltaproteobacteria bacterium]|nr:hypothetical protein [Deltaproteobacteria bacterium]
MSTAIEFLLNPDITYLNHGSYGATPKKILDEQRRWQQKMEEEPVQFMHEIRPPALEKSREDLSHFLGVQKEEIFFVHNATQGIFMVAQQRIKKGMKVVCTSHRYQAVYHTLHYLCTKAQAQLEIIEIPFGVHTKDDLTQTIIEQVPNDCDLFFLDEISSASAMRFPVSDVCEFLKKRSPSIEIVIDGAHSPGHVQTNFSNVDYWTGNLHKWLCAPKGVAALYVSQSNLENIHAPIISHGYNQGLAQEMEWMGTHDPSAILCTPTVLELHEELGGVEFRKRNHMLMQWARKEICNAFPHFITDPSIDGLAMCSFILPFKEKLYQSLFHEHQIEIFVNPWGDKLVLRISCMSAYNKKSDYKHLIQALYTLGY